MKKQSASRSSFFIPRAALGLVLLLFGLSIGLLAQGPNTPAAFAPSANMPSARFKMGMAYDARSGATAPRACARAENGRLYNSPHIPRTRTRARGRLNAMM